MAWTKAKSGLKVVGRLVVSAVFTGATAWAVLAYAVARGVEKAARFATGRTNDA